MKEFELSSILAFFSPGLYFYGQGGELLVTIVTVALCKVYNDVVNIIKYYYNIYFLKSI